MELIIYPLLSTTSKRAIIKVKKKWGHYYEYTPRNVLILRLAEDLNWTEEAVRRQIVKEREFLTKNRRYFR